MIRLGLDIPDFELVKTRKDEIVAPSGLGPIFPVDYAV
jgi:hypothetical protein